MIQLTFAIMAETVKEEVDEANEVNDLPEWHEDAKESLKKWWRTYGKPSQAEEHWTYEVIQSKFKKSGQPYEKQKAREYKQRTKPDLKCSVTTAALSKLEHRISRTIFLSKSKDRKTSSYQNYVRF